MKFSYDFSNGNSRMFYYAEEEEMLDTTVWNMIQYHPEIPYLVDMSVEKTGEGLCLSYEISDVTNMLAWADSASFREKQEMEKRKEEALRELERFMIPREELLMTEQYLYVDDKTGDIRFMCVPLKKKDQMSESRENFGQNDPDFFKEVRENPLPPAPPLPDSEFVLQGFDEEEPSQKGLFRRRKEKKEKTEEPAFYKKQPEISNTWNMTGSSNMDATYIRGMNAALGNPQPPQEPQMHTESPEQTEMHRDPMKDLFGFGEDDNEGTTLLHDDGNEGTVLLKAPPRIHASIMRKRTQEIFFINTEAVVIGKRALDVDICIRENPTISRKHCMIRFHDDAFYLEDCDSMNGTYLDGEKVNSGEPVKLYEGCIIKMSDEEFLFHEF